MIRRLLGKAPARLGLAALALLLAHAAHAQEPSSSQMGFGGATFGAPGCGAGCASGSCGVASIGAPTSGWLNGPCTSCPLPIRCPHYKWCSEGCPRICWRCGCPKPICNPCVAGAPNWGYFQKCWTPWPWPPDWSHCPVQPPAATIMPGWVPHAQSPAMMTPSPEEILPTPRQLEVRPSLQ